MEGKGQGDRDGRALLVRQFSSRLVLAVQRRRDFMQSSETNGVLRLMYMVTCSMSKADGWFSTITSLAYYLTRTIQKLGAHRIKYPSMLLSDDRLGPR